MKLYLLVLLISNTICIDVLIRYEIEFLNLRIFSPCENYPNNSMDSIIDMSNLQIEQTEEASIVLKGYVIIKKSVDAPAPLTIEIFKKERGTWQPTVITLKRPDTCTACYSQTEIWHTYLKNTPEEQLKCPFREGQRLDFNITEPAYIHMLSRKREGELKLQIESGHRNSNYYVCTNVFLKIHKA